MPEDTNTSDRAFLGFSLGPVQTFIASAHSVRDLWTGSYLLSWLTFQAMKPIITECRVEAFVFPSIRTNPLCRRLIGEGQNVDPRAILSPCLPNRFVAEVPASQADELAKKCRDACSKAWLEIAQDVKELIKSRMSQLCPSPRWDLNWDGQIMSFFEICVSVLPWKACEKPTLDALLEPPPGDVWCGRLDLAGRILASSREVRHVPDYRAKPDDAGRVPPKCTLLGSYEQMGPADLSESKAFWRAFAEFNRGGTKTRAREGLCAVSLVKRFAWVAHFCESLGLNADDLRYSDTATIAAAEWLDKGNLRLVPDDIRREHHAWSGQWLHWPKSNHDPDEQEVPGPVWKMITEKRSKEAEGPPPTYYAILMMDGDKMGDKLRNADKARLEVLSSALSTFAVEHVRRIVEGHSGTLIYAGGDDVLAMLPTAQAIDCAQDLASKYSEVMPKDSDDKPATISAGIAVVHYKEDLRFALQAARNAEKAAKTAGRDALCLSVCRRSGEHASAVLPWDMCDELNELLKQFVGIPKQLVGPKSDRWAYALRRELPTLIGLPWKAVRSEVLRLASRVEDGGFRTWLSNWIGGNGTPTGFLDLYRTACQAPARKHSLPEDGDVLTGFVTLCQSASFLARGRDS